ncbi:UbiA family prenyltransferase [Rhodopseudomonas palustris]
MRIDDSQNFTELPLAVDLDGTLIVTDSLHESIFSALRARPSHCRHLFSFLRGGKAVFKRHIANAAITDAATFPYNAPFVDFLKEQRRAGRRLGLFSAADDSLVQSVAKHLGLFDVVVGSDGRENFSGARKLAAIRQAFGERFAYAGDSKADLPIFEAAETVVLVGAGNRFAKRLAGITIVERVFPSPVGSYRTWIKALRLEHWAKNLLVFAAPILAQKFTDLETVAQSLLLFVLVGMVASGNYIINDLFDLEADRKHPRKRLRAFAAGLISVQSGMTAAIALISSAFLISLLLPLGCTLTLLAYLAVALVYSLLLKRLAVVDVMILAALFSLRVLAGGFLVPDGASPWLLTFSMLFFFCLATVKRYAELERGVRVVGHAFRARGYTEKDLPLLLSAGVASGLGAIVVFMIYLINDQYPRAIYGHPQILWVMMPILMLWTLRVWHLSVHGLMNEDPLVFALKDRLSLVLGVLGAAAFIAASW